MLAPPSSGKSWSATAYWRCSKLNPWYVLQVGMLDLNEAVGKQTAGELISEFGSGSCVFSEVTLQNQNRSEVLNVDLQVFQNRSILEQAVYTNILGIPLWEQCTEQQEDISVQCNDPLSNSPCFIVNKFEHGGARALYIGEDWVLVWWYPWHHG